MRVDLLPIRDLLERLGSPQRGFRAIHVAGTKGKGSVAALVSAGLRRFGLRTGVYASPHVMRVQERVVVDGRDAADDDLSRALEEALEAKESAAREATPARDATWFDVLTAAAFSVFARSGLDVAVVECGLGGRLDSTNVLASPLAVLTNVDLEHTEVLGTTRRAIAREKADIVTPGGTLVTGVGAGDEAGREVARIARERGARVLFVPPRPALPLADQNALLAGAVLDEVGRGVLAAGPYGGEEGLPPGIAGGAPKGRGDAPGAWLLDEATRASARLPGRLEKIVLGGVPVVLDGAHVASSLAAVLRDLEADPELVRQPWVIFGIGADKDAPALLKVLQGRVDRVFCTSAGTGLSFPSQDLRDEARRAGLRAETAPEPEAAFERARDSVPPGGWVLVTGSLHLVGRIRARIGSELPRPPCSPSSPISS